jgi:hypothetical protein
MADPFRIANNSQPDDWCAPASAICVLTFDALDPYRKIAGVKYYTTIIERPPTAALA